MTRYTSREPEPVPELTSAPTISLVSPAFNECDNLAVMYERVASALSDIEATWEWIVVDDHSSDDTYGVIQSLAEKDPRVRGVRLSRNLGSHKAITCGLHLATGRCVIVLAADLQDPPEMIQQLLVEWEQGHQVVWAARAKRAGETASTVGLASVYYWIMRHVVQMQEIPAEGADFFLLDRAVVDGFCRFRETNVSVLALIAWMGYRQTSISYEKEARLHGSSGWTLAKKIKLVVDSVAAFSFLPIRLISFAGIGVGLLGFLYATFIVAYAPSGSPVPGWSSLMVVTLLLGGLQMLIMGVLGEYIWRALDEARDRPAYLVEASTEARDGTRAHRGRG